MVGDSGGGDIARQSLKQGSHSEKNSFELIKKLLEQKVESTGSADIQTRINEAYAFVRNEIISNSSNPREPVKFGTSGWRGILGEDVNLRTVACVTQAIVDMYQTADDGIFGYLGVGSLAEARERGCVVGHDNRFGREMFGWVVARVLTRNGFKVLYAGEATTGALSAAVLMKKAAFSVNLTPSHNPLEYGGYKFNAADGGPAAAELTYRITELTSCLLQDGFLFDVMEQDICDPVQLEGVVRVDALGCWKSLVRTSREIHQVDLDAIMQSFTGNDDIVVAVDSVHGASRLDITSLFGSYAGGRLVLLRENDDPTFGGIAPEPSSANIQLVTNVLAQRKEVLKIGAIIDPDGDRIRFTDGSTEISMNQFGAMVYHFLTVYKKMSGMVAKTVASSNLANSIASVFREEVFESRVGFKEFKPVVGKALVFFEESDGISIIGHTPEKDAYIGLLLAMDIVLTTGRNLGDYLAEIENEFGAYYPDRDGVEVQVKGKELLDRLEQLEKYDVGSVVSVGSDVMKIEKVIDIDGRKMIFEDGSWLMIRPSGTEPKVRFYVESRTTEGTSHLVTTAKTMLEEIGLV
ncbi:phosphoglucomutase [Desulfopila sp. IMCC35008]|uniref:phosphoglucomutase n=1 Tax=Desulfopila sp. IMCC35008 TaxID=2653858 RepID=UPI0013D1A993|nr:phosphoglucomutase [Desulfopila sp. IMCC35008]